ncbi:unnamed protein product [Paramecium sonneborni]|uniref:Uncharacterized protein n=1 Tax=Paramecium sonneborni TaxID=65129 RepID=A0A8S1NRR8_9CILI|nr:unnamed protein product [Paramecium sonneborni]
MIINDDLLKELNLQNLQSKRVEQNDSTKNKIENTNAQSPYIKCIVLILGTLLMFGNNYSFEILKLYRVNQLNNQKLQFPNLIYCIQHLHFQISSQLQSEESQLTYQLQYQIYFRSESGNNRIQFNYCDCVTHYIIWWFISKLFDNVKLVGLSLEQLQKIYQQHKLQSQEDGLEEKNFLLLLDMLWQSLNLHVE